MHLFRMIQDQMRNLKLLGKLTCFFHSTVKEACQLAEELQIPHLILYHTEEMHLKERKELYTREGREYYHGKLFVPDDLEVFEL